MLKVKNKHLIFKTSIAMIEIYLLIYNKNETKLIDEFFIHANKILFFELEKLLTLHLEMAKLFSKLLKKPLLT